MLGAMLALALQTASDPPCIMSTATLEATLKFADYPARAWRGPVARPRQDTRFARLFRTVLKQGAVKGPNFAGHMTIVEFGCGTSCVYWGLVDAKTGRPLTGASPRQRSMQSRFSLHQARRATAWMATANPQPSMGQIGQK